MDIKPEIQVNIIVNYLTRKVTSSGGIRHIDV
jgi:hypothetical protein